MLRYDYFRDGFGLPNLPERLGWQVEQIRFFFGVASLTVLTGRDMVVGFRSSTGAMGGARVTRANDMVHITTNNAVATAAPKFDKRRLADTIGFALTQTTSHEGFHHL